MAALRASRAVLSKTLYGRKSERQERPHCDRRRGQQPGVRGHGRTARPGLEQRDEVQDLAARARRCSGCGTPQSQQWNAFIARYHYLGYKTLVGAQMRYTVHDRHGGLLALLGFSTAARKLAPRDRFIGWTPALREKNLPRVIDNARFLILPWITIPNLASHILSAAGRQLPPDWAERYNTTPVLIETFVETPRFTGATYKASGWTQAGITQGRGRYDRHKKYDKPKKTIWLRPLRKDRKRTLNR